MMEPGQELGAGGWVLPLPSMEQQEVRRKEDLVGPGGWDPHLLDKADEEKPKNMVPVTKEMKAYLKPGKACLTILVGAPTFQGKLLSLWVHPLKFSPLGGNPNSTEDFTTVERE